MSTAPDDLMLIGPSQASSILGVSEKTLKRLIKAGALPGFKVGGQWRIRESLLRKWIEDRERASSAPGED